MRRSPQPAAMHRGGQSDCAHAACARVRMCAEALRERRGCGKRSCEVGRNNRSRERQSAPVRYTIVVSGPVAVRSGSGQCLL